MEVEASGITFLIPDLLKQSRVGNVGHRMHLRKYPSDKRLCVYTYILEYLKRTKLCRQAEKKLFVSFRRPHKAVSTDTISRWLRSIMSEAGLDKHFRPHSIRSASVSKAAAANIPMNDILSHVGWSSEQTFCKFYLKPIATQSNFAEAVLS